MNALLTLVGLLMVTKTDNTSAQQSIGSAVLGVGLFRTINEISPLKGG